MAAKSRSNRSAPKWIPNNLHKGALHRQMGISPGKHIPHVALEKAAAKGGLLGKRANLALTFAKMRDRGG